MTKENTEVFVACVSYHQLLYPLGENSPIAGFLKKKADGGIHHICIEVRRLQGCTLLKFFIDVVAIVVL